MLSTRTKYPRTPHLPWSPGATEEDVRATATTHFEGLEVVVTEKMDGENTTMYRDGVHARSIDSRHHPSRDRIKRLQAEIGHEIPAGWRLCGENLYARHSIAYTNLAGYFYLFSIWGEDNRCLSWDETLEWARLLDLPTPRQLFRGTWRADAIQGINVDDLSMEGYVVRKAGRFGFDAFQSSVAKWVRPNHVQTDTHWMHAQVVPNTLAEDG